MSIWRRLGRLTCDSATARGTDPQLGGYSIVEARDLDEVIAVAARHPWVLAGLSIEVRPIRVGPPQ